LHKGYKITILVNTVSKPLMVGFYNKEGFLVDTKEYEGLTSDILLPILKEIVEEVDVEKIIYTSGPGSHMATKIAFVLLKTLNIVKNIPIFAISAFDLNGSKPIKALGKLYFVKEKENIITKRFEENINSSFYMPDSLDKLNILKEIEPNYQIAAV